MKQILTVELLITSWIIHQARLALVAGIILLFLPRNGFCAVPEFVEKSATFWLDAASAPSMVMENDKVTEWRDARFDGHSFAKKATVHGQAQLMKDKLLGNKPYVWMSAGQFFSFADETKIRAVFWVIRADAPNAFLLGRMGGVQGYYDFHRNIDSGNGELWDRRYAANGLLNGATYFNGTRIDGTEHELDANFNLISLVASEPLAANTLAADRSAARAGNIRVAEVILFDAIPTDEQRIQVEKYLAAKWGLADYGKTPAKMPLVSPLSTWLEPAAPGRNYPDGEASRQWGVLQHDLKKIDRFRQFASETFCADALVTPEDKDPLTILLRRTQSLLNDIKSMRNAPSLESETKALADLVARAKTAAEAQRRPLFDEALLLRRKIAFSNPLLNFNELLFIKRDLSQVMQHCCDQYYGQQQRTGGGLLVLSDPFGESPAIRDVLAGSGLKIGTRQDMGKDGGSVLSPALSYDGKMISFAYVEGKGGRAHISHLDHANNGHWDKGFCYHLFTVGSDGTNLKQITDGTFNDFSPCFTPAGRIAFISERRGGYLRCGRQCPNYTMFDMAVDGTDMRCLSFHETNEWAPSITHDGMLLWTRWDYVDRHGCTAHHPWITTPDGRNPRPIHGNYSLRYKRSDMEIDTRSIPNSQCFIATGAPHHGQAFGSLVVIDPRVADDDAMAPVKRLTPDAGFPETQGGSQSYGTAWPLSDTYYIASYEPAEANVGGKHLTFGIYLIDKFGNKELIYRDPQIACVSPRPLRAETRPPVIPEQRIAAVPAAQRKPADWQAEARGQGTITIADVYKSYLSWPEDAGKISALRIWQIYPASVATAELAHWTGIQIKEGFDSDNLVRTVVGTVPVESDGSAYFKVPTGYEIFFQALDEQGAAIQSMRSATALVPGEQLSCQGCHEPKGTAPDRLSVATPLAMRREPSLPKPGPDGSLPFSYPKLVQPVLDKKCVSCHAEKIKQAKPGEKLPPRLDSAVNGKYFTSYVNLAEPYGYVSYGAGQDFNSPKFYRTIPGQFGARASKLYKILKQGHHDVKLTTDEMERITVWLDSACQFYGVYEKDGGEKQLRGEFAEPTLK